MKSKIWGNSKLYKYLIISLELVVIIISLSFTIGSYFVSRQSIYEQQKNLFAQRTATITDSIKERIINYEQILRGGKGLISALSNITRDDWKNYIDSLSIDTRYPGIQQIGYAPYITNNQKNNFTKNINSSENSNFIITPDVNKDYFIPILFIQPDNPQNLAMTGFDISSNAEFMHEIQLSEDSGDFVISSKLNTFIDNSLNNSFLNIYLPIYGNKTNTSTVSERQKNIKGFIFGSFKIKEFINGIFKTELDDINIKVYLDNQDRKNLIYDNASITTNSLFTNSINIPIADKNWIASFSSLAKFDHGINYEESYNILIRGTFFCLFLTIFFYFITTSRLHALRVVKKVTKELQNTNAFQQALINASNYAIISTNKNGVISSFNKGATKLLGYRPNQVIKKVKIEKVYDDLDLQISIRNLKKLGNNVNSSFEAIIANTKYFLKNEREWTFIKDNNEKIPVYVSTSIIKNEVGEIIGYMMIAEDITERKKAEEAIRVLNTQLQRSNNELQDFASIASHDLQEPLRKIQAFGDRLKQKYGSFLPEEGKDYINRMENAALRMQNLIDALLTYSRITTKAKPFEKVDLNNILNDVLSDLEISIEQENANIEKDVLPIIEADSLQMRQLFQNLITNSLKFHKIGENPHILIKSSIITDVLNTQFARITVKDNGIGFDEKYLDKIFTIFQRLNNSAEYKGSGIGLAICRKIVMRHKGSITAKSKVDEGTIFIIELPIKEQAHE